MADEQFVDYVQVFKGDDGDWYFHAKSNNGQVLSASEGYKRKLGAIDAAAAMFPDKSVEVKGG